MKNLTLTLLVPIAVLFAGCGGGSNDEVAFAISADSLKYKVVEGMKKDLQLRANRDNVSFEILDKSEAPRTIVDKNRGVLEFRAPDTVGGGTQKVTVAGVDASGKQSSPLTLTFTTVSKNIQSTVKVLKTGADDGAFGEERLFGPPNADGDVVDPLGYVWAETTDDKLTQAQSYLNAFNKCEVLKLKNEGSNWRLPTKDEALNLVDYSKTTGTSMLDDAFSNQTMTYMWVQAENENNMVLSLNYALIANIGLFDQQQNYTSRCVNALANSNEHIISTDKRNNRYTYDFSTNLQWSPITTESQKPDANESVEQYCANYKGESGWRVPNINELGSITEGSTVSTFIRGNATTLVSSTPYNDANTTARKANYVMYLREDGTIGFGREYVDVVFGITCVKNID